MRRTICALQKWENIFLSEASFYILFCGKNPYFKYLLNSSFILSRPLDESERLPVRTHRITSPQTERKEDEEPEPVSRFCILMLALPLNSSGFSEIRISY